MDLKAAKVVSVKCVSVTRGGIVADKPAEIIMLILNNFAISWLC